MAQFALASCYASGAGVAKDDGEAVKWLRQAADQHLALAQRQLGECYFAGRGVVQDELVALNWFRLAAEQNDAQAQFNLGGCCFIGKGVLTKQEAEGYKWCLLASAQGLPAAQDASSQMATRMTPEKIAEGHRLARDFKPTTVPPAASGTGFFITDDGYLITNQQLAGNGAQVRLVTAEGVVGARLIKEDVANDLALLKVEGRFTALPVVSNSPLRPGSPVATVGFPKLGIQGFAPTSTTGKIAALSGAQNESNYLQITAPVSTGNTGGPLLDDCGNVIGVALARLYMSATQTMPANVDYAVNSSVLLDFIKTVPEVAAKLRKPTAENKARDAVKSSEQAIALVVRYY